MTNFTNAFVHNILSNWGDHHWSVQGFGFLRTYFGPHENPKRYRLNLWDSRFAVPGVSTVHDHPWHFKSLIIAGAFCNQRFDVVPSTSRTATHHFTTIRTGEGGGMEESPIENCVLVSHRPEVYAPGDTYYQRADEVHETMFSDGSVTLNERHPLADGDHARVFWRFGTDWIDAIPRVATNDEVRLAVIPCLERWF